MHLKTGSQFGEVRNGFLVELSHFGENYFSFRNPPVLHQPPGTLWDKPKRNYSMLLHLTQSECCISGIYCAIVPKYYSQKRPLSMSIVYIVSLRTARWGGAEVQRHCTPRRGASSPAGGWRATPGTSPRTPRTQYTRRTCAIAAQRTLTAARSSPASSL